MNPSDNIDVERTCFCRRIYCQEAHCIIDFREILKTEFAETHRSQVLFWGLIFGMDKGLDVALRVQVITCYLEIYYLLLITRPDQFKQFMNILAKRRKNIEFRMKSWGPSDGTPHEDLLNDMLLIKGTVQTRKSPCTFNDKKAIRGLMEPPGWLEGPDEIWMPGIETPSLGGHYYAMGPLNMHITIVLDQPPFKETDVKLLLQTPLIEYVLNTDGLDDLDDDDEDFYDNSSITILEDLLLGNPPEEYELKFALKTAQKLKKHAIVDTLYFYYEEHMDLYNKRDHAFYCKNLICIKYGHVWWAEVYANPRKAESMRKKLEDGKSLNETYNSVNTPSAMEICSEMKNEVKSRMEYPPRMVYPNPRNPSYESMFGFPRGKA